MAAHASWKGFLKISLASVPVQAYTSLAGKESSEISLHQLHRACKRRIQYRKVCPIHGEVDKDEIVSGYEYAPGQYAIISQDEIAKLSAEMEKSLSIDAFVSPDRVDLAWAAGQSYYLVPDGKAGEKPYALIRTSLSDHDLIGIGEMVISRRQHLVRLRVADPLLVVDLLRYQGELRPPTKHENAIRNVPLSSQELKLTYNLIDQMTNEDLDFSEYANDYMDRMKHLIETKVKGKRIPVPQVEEEPDVINFLDAIKKSVKEVQAPKHTKRKSTAATATSVAHRKSKSRRA